MSLQALQSQGFGVSHTFILRPVCMSPWRRVEPMEVLRINQKIGVAGQFE